ncbi:MAG TPA: DUF1634 domain-containing protein [Gemmataceae bacterium]|jgi:uncharacterized membrane protein|nr:DUF1634 domain-containing protein [Gemmataceae bacterium]
MPEAPWTDRRVEVIVGNLLRFGVLLAAVVVLIGGILYLVQHGSEAPDYRTFDENRNKELRTLSGTLKAAWHLESRGLIQLGLFILIATPVARVAFTIYAFLRERDYTYVAITLIVLAVLLYSLFGGHP